MRTNVWKKVSQQKGMIEVGLGKVLEVGNVKKMQYKDNLSRERRNAEKIIQKEHQVTMRRLLKEEERISQGHEINALLDICGLTQGPIVSGGQQELSFLIPLWLLDLSGLLFPGKV